MDPTTGIIMAVLGALIIIGLFVILIPRWSRANKAKSGAPISGKFFEIRKENQKD
ncbi:hypothetical protein V1639_13415 [Pseudarthrobacter sp. J75]|uniref:hypothetical protein n=1 Tax=unclassified Pseudarthrobacter TaxID=2647000 RepID=UPI002E802EFC|nr:MULTISPECIES: hypothetical protein [unclassified Pseudarthrobacter]MEE2523628.1 hypothetical protein [Pseudarthrobacter sp. J47]MEE2530018.1 hypothetical protein [Pseudarthrobacter sp. J75]MEE2570572.1 hypothetical protein [Pseudarthrobacter sp. J64]